MAFRMSEQPRTIKIYNLLAGTNEFIGEGDAYIPPHTGLPANSTALRGLKHWEKPATLNTDKAPSYGAAITELKREGKLDRETAHRQVKYLNNVIEADHGKLKILIKPVRGFKSIPTAYATIKGFEVMRALRKGQARPWCLQPGIPPRQ
nr:DDE-type integrase/transposase/recombinase [Escherichia coli]